MSPLEHVDEFISRPKFQLLLTPLHSFFIPSMTVRVDENAWVKWLEATAGCVIMLFRVVITITITKSGAMCLDRQVRQLCDYWRLGRDIQVYQTSLRCDILGRDIWLRDGRRGLPGYHQVHQHAQV